MSNGGRPPHVDASSQERGDPAGGEQSVVDSRAPTLESATGSRDAVGVPPVRRPDPRGQPAVAGRVTAQRHQTGVEHPDEYSGSTDHPAASSGGPASRGSRDARPSGSVTGRATGARSTLGLVKHGVIDGVTFIAFLAAVSLPFLYLPLILFGGIDAGRSTEFLLLLGLHVVTLIIGYRYDPQNPLGGP